MLTRGGLGWFCFSRLGVWDRERRGGGVGGGGEGRGKDTGLLLLSLHLVW